MKEYFDEETFIIGCITAAITMYVIYRMLPW